MPWYDIVRNHEPGGNAENIAKHGLTPEDVEVVIRDPLDKTIIRSTGRPVVTRYAARGRPIVDGVCKLGKTATSTPRKLSGRHDSRSE
jgi:hypothetical protein